MNSEYRSLVSTQAILSFLQGSFAHLVIITLHFSANDMTWEEWCSYYGFHNDCFDKLVFDINQ